MMPSSRLAEPPKSQAARSQREFGGLFVECGMTRS